MIENGLLAWQPGNNGMSWQEVGAFLGALITILVTISAFAFNYLRRDSSSLETGAIGVGGGVWPPQLVGR